ncbi:MAG TPA: phosphoserine transaminase [Alphaproteobacteria bacterium]|nr:phosphoserine transaminase [Alphaproteobacteria bacterium]
MKPTQRPRVPNFSSGPCAKRPGWTPAALADAAVGRSHRSGLGKARLKAAIDRTRAVLGVPADYRIAIVPASDTGAVEMAMWSLLGQRGVDLLSWESFGAGWVTDAVKQLKLEARVLEAGYGELPDLGEVDFGHDVVFCWNGTTSGVRVPNSDWIPADREGLTICDATSAAFAMALPWDKLDVTTFSWQKVLGGEGQHGMLILSPRAVERLESYTPPWPLPKIFRLTKGGKLQEGPFKGETINTPSMLCVEDYLDALDWAEKVGGHKALIARSEGNLALMAEWVAATPWVEFLAKDPAARSCTSVCLSIVDDWFTGLAGGDQAAAAKQLVKLLEDEGVAYDIGAYRDAPPGLRIWCGATVEADDIRALLPWLDWAFGEVKATYRPAA